jgi:hypothetical protein
MNTLPAILGNDLSTLRRLTLQEIYDAFNSNTPICGFYVVSMGITVTPIDINDFDRNTKIYPGLKDITLIHEKTGTRIDLDRDGNASAKYDIPYLQGRQ